MKLVTYTQNGENRTGLLLGDQVVDLNRANADIPTAMIDLLEGGEAMMAKVRRVEAAAPAGVPLDSVQLKAPVLKSGKVLCLGLNYRLHAEEGGMDIPTIPILFHKSRTSLVGHGENVVLPAGATRADYEVELAVIIGKTAKNVSEEDALSYVAGYACANDVSERAWQMQTSQWSAGKMVDTFGPLGPALVTADEIPNPNALQLRLIYNGEEVQNSNTSDMVFDVPYTIAYVSKICTLEPGDVIMTGTPSGVGFARKPPIFLKAGDVMTVEIEGLGSLTNPVVQG